MSSPSLGGALCFIIFKSATVTPASITVPLGNDGQIMLFRAKSYQRYTISNYLAFCSYNILISKWCNETIENCISLNLIL